MPIDRELLRNIDLASMKVKRQLWKHLKEKPKRLEKDDEGRMSPISSRRWVYLWW